MDDDGSKSLSYEEFKKGISDYGLTMSKEVRCKEAEGGSSAREGGTP